MSEKLVPTQVLWLLGSICLLGIACCMLFDLLSTWNLSVTAAHLVFLLPVLLFLCSGRNVRPGATAKCCWFAGYCTAACLIYLLTFWPFVALLPDAALSPGWWFVWPLECSAAASLLLPLPICLTKVWRLRELSAHKNWLAAGFASAFVIISAVNLPITVGMSVNSWRNSTDPSTRAFARTFISALEQSSGADTFTADRGSARTYILGIAAGFNAPVRGCEK